MDEFDEWVAQGRNPFENIENGPVHTVSRQDLTDAELLATKPIIKDSIELPAKVPAFKYKDSLPEELIGAVADFGKDMYDYAKADPANFAYDWTGLSLVDVPHDMAEMIGWDFGIKYLPTLRPAVSAIGSIFKPQTYQKKLEGMIANPEDYAE